MIPACNQLHELWGPNEGCKEFMTEPEAVFECGQPATKITVIHEDFYPHDEGVCQVIWSCLDCEPPTPSTPYCTIIYPQETGT